jgi:RNA polymerase sigma-70 factor (ECF subfamily)
VTADPDDPEAPSRDPVETAIRELIDAGDLDGAASLAITHYGPELHGFLCALSRDPDLAADAFGAASENLWRNLTKFRWEASLRTWAYQLARNALHALRRDPRRRPERNLPLSVAASIAAVPRSTTAPYQRGEVMAGLRELIESLDAEDQEILILRLDRRMSWKDIARATAEETDPDSTLDQRAATLRKRYERTKTLLKKLALERGLLDH